MIPQQLHQQQEFPLSHLSLLNHRVIPHQYHQKEFPVSYRSLPDHQIILQQYHQQQEFTHSHLSLPAQLSPTQPSVWIPAIILQ